MPMNTMTAIVYYECVCYVYYHTQILCCFSFDAEIIAAQLCVVEKLCPAYKVVEFNTKAWSNYPCTNLEFS